MASRIHREVYVRFWEGFGQTYGSNAARRLIPTLRREKSRGRFLDKIGTALLLRPYRLHLEKETTGTVISVTKQWWLKVNRKPVRTHAMDGAAFPHIIKVKYTIGVKDYTCQKWIGAGNKIPDKGTTIKVIYCEDKPSKARIEL